MTRKAEVVIIGTGLAGTVAYHALKAYRPLCIDARPEPKNGMLGIHPAVMRLRDRRVADTIGAKFEAVRISKAIYINGNLYTESDIRFNNLYSRKVYGALGRRSLHDLKDSDRFILPEGYPAPPETIWGHKAINIHNVLNAQGVLDSRQLRIEGPDHDMIEYRYLISTIPMPTMATYIAGSPEDFKVDFSYQSVRVLTIKLNISSNVHQTIYFPSPDTPVYRITIQKGYVIVEATEKTDDWIKLLQSAFGLDYSDFNGVKGAADWGSWLTLPIGKIFPIDEDSRMRYIMWLTDEFKIFSFGRFAVWKPLRTDHLIGDMESIRRIISASDIEGRYKGRL